MDQTTLTRPTPPDGQLRIGDQWRDAADGGRRDVIDPSTGETVVTVAEATSDDVDAAVRAARAAQPGWAAMPARERGRVLARLAALLREHGDEVVGTESLDVGKPISLCRQVDLTTVAEEYDYYGALAWQLDGAVRELPMPAHAYTRREPLGVVAAITPFNFPLILSASKIAPALAAGNAVVHKPSEETPLSALLVARLAAEAGLPDGVLNVVTGGGAVGEALVQHPGIDGVAFTGSTAVGRAVGREAGERLLPVSLELGGNGPNIVFADADVEKAVEAVIGAFIFNTGQFCMAGPRLLVADELHDTMVGILSEAVPGIPVGDPFDPSTVIGPMVGERHLAKVVDHVATAREAGGRVVAGGGRPDGPGYFHEATVITDLPADSSTVAQEVFGPVLTVQRFSDEDEAVALANGTPYGLAAGVQTSDIGRAHRVAARLEAGIVWVNGWALLDPAMPFGGVGHSGTGREYGPEGLAAYTRTKSVIVSLG